MQQRAVVPRTQPSPCISLGKTKFTHSAFPAELINPLLSSAEAHWCHAGGDRRGVRQRFHPGGARRVDQDEDPHLHPRDSRVQRGRLGVLPQCHAVSGPRGRARGREGCDAPGIRPALFSRSLLRAGPASAGRCQSQLDLYRVFKKYISKQAKN